MSLRKYYPLFEQTGCGEPQDLQTNLTLLHDVHEVNKVKYLALLQFNYTGIFFSYPGDLSSYKWFLSDL